MRTLSLLKDMPVYNSGGELLGEVCDLALSKNGKVTSLLLKRKGFFSNIYNLPIHQIEAFGEHGIVLRNDIPLEKYKENEHEHTFFHSHPVLKKLAISNSGEQLGLFEDVYFMEELGTIVGYELTDGFFTDIMEGKRVIQSVHPPKFGKDAIIVSVNHLRGGVSYDKVPKLPK